MDVYLLPLMTIYGVLNGLGTVLVKKGFTVGNYNYFSSTSLGFKDILDEFYRLVKYVIKNKYILSSIVVTIASFIFYQIALKFFPLSDVKALVNLNVVFTIFFGVIILKERISKKEIAGLLFSLTGIIIIGLISEPTNAVPNYFNFYLFSIFCAGIIVVSLKIFYKFKLNHERVIPLIVSFGYIVGNVANKILLLSISNVDLQTLISLIQNSMLYFFIVGYSTAILIYIIALSAQARVSILSLLVSIFTTLFAIIAGLTIFAETFSPENVLGLGLIFIGMGLIYWQRRKKAPDVQTQFVNR
jgi:drug/metabolite transporter (DMT)-like permease